MRLQQAHERRAAQASERHLHGMLLDQHWVQEKMAAFHSKLTQLEYRECTTCFEAFPSMHFRSGSSECICCSRDKKVPKLYSRDNSMDPGPVPPEVQGLTQVEEMLISTVMPVVRFPIDAHVWTMP